MTVTPFLDISASVPSIFAATETPGNFLRINAITRIIPTAKQEVERYLMEDILAGVHGLKSPLVYLILGAKLKINVFLGLLSKPTAKTQPPRTLRSWIAV